MLKLIIIHHIQNHIIALSDFSLEPCRRLRKANAEQLIIQLGEIMTI